MRTIHLAIVLATLAPVAARAQEGGPATLVSQQEAALTVAYQAQLALLRGGPGTPITTLDGARVGTERSHGQP